MDKIKMNESFLINHMVSMQKSQLNLTDFLKQNRFNRIFKHLCFELNYKKGLIHIYIQDSIANLLGVFLFIILSEVFEWEKKASFMENHFMIN